MVEPDSAEPISQGARLASVLRSRAAGAPARPVEAGARHDADRGHPQHPERASDRGYRRIADTMLFLHEGRVLARGTAADLERSEHELVRKFMQSKAGG